MRPGRLGSHRLAQLGEPDRAAAAALVFGEGGDDSEALVIEECPVLRAVEAGVIQWLPFKASNGLTLRRPAREHQRGTGGGMSPE